MSFQSRLGRDPWLQPYTDKTIENMPMEGKTKLVVVTPAFVADCLETLEEMNMENRELFMESGGEEYRYVPCLNNRDDWAQLITDWQTSWSENYNKHNLTINNGVQKDSELYNHSVKVMPGGVNSPVRAFKSVGGTPIFIKEAKGSRIYDIDGYEYIDYINSWGPQILGHAHPSIVAALKKQVDRGTSFGTPTENEAIMAELVINMVGSVDKESKDGQ